MKLFFALHRFHVIRPYRLETPKQICHNSNVLGMKPSLTRFETYKNVFDMSLKRHKNTSFFLPLKTSSYAIRFQTSGIPPYLYLKDVSCLLGPQIV